MFAFGSFSLALSPDDKLFISLSLFLLKKEHRELIQAVLGGDGVTSGVLGVLASMLLNSLVFVCGLFLISSYELLIF